MRLLICAVAALCAVLSVVALTLHAHHDTVGVERVQLTPDAVPGLTDDQLRADILRLEGDLKLPVKGSVARAKKFAAAKQRKAANSLGQGAKQSKVPANSSEDTEVAQELKNVEKEVGMLTKAVMKQITPPKMQILKRSESARVEGDGSGPPLELPVEAHPTDQSHCFLPDVWARGQCRSDPRGNPVLAREYQKYCGGDENAPACKAYKSRYNRLVQEYEKDIREASPFRYSKTGESAADMIRAQHHAYDRDFVSKELGLNQNGELAKSLNALSTQIRTLDPWTGSLTPNAFAMTPERFPHGDGADLGDNFVSGLGDEHGEDDDEDDKTVLASEAAMKQPAELSTFFGTVAPQPKPLFGDKTVHPYDAKILNKDRGLLPYASQEFAFGHHSPLNPTLRDVLFGTSSRMFNDKAGFPSDVIPSAKQFQNQVSPKVPKDVLVSRIPWKISLPVKQVWKEKDGIWKPTLVPKHEKCSGKKCSTTCKGSSCGHKNKPVMLCGPLGCKSVAPKVDAEDPIMDQMSKGGLEGVADPFGVVGTFADDEEPVDVADLDQGIGHMFRHNGGEPVGDIIVRGWDMHNGVDHVAADTSEETEH